MSIKLVSVVLLGAAVTAFAATPPAVNYYSAAELQQMGQKLGTKVNQAKFASDNLERYKNSYTMLAHREGTGSAEVHEHDADLFLVVQGDATIVTGGKIVKPHTEKPGEIRGESIEGGQRQAERRRRYPHLAERPSPVVGRKRQAVHLLRSQGDRLNRTNAVRPVTNS